MMKIKDHFLSQELFEVLPSKYKGILKTVPEPTLSELPKYYDSKAYISHQSQVTSLKDFVYQKVKSLMLNRKRKWIYKYFESGSILDIGAGTGDFLKSFESEYWDKSAIEPSEKMHQIIEELNVKRYDNLNQLIDHSQDVVSMWHSLEHISDIENTASHLKRILKPNGVLFIAVPNHNSYDAQFYKSYWAAWDVPRHLWHFSREGIQSFFSNYGFECLEQKPLIFDAYYVSLLSEKYKPKGNPLRSFYRAWLSNLKAKRNKEYSSILYVFKPL